MKIQVQRLHPNVPLLAYAHPGDAGMDLFSAAGVVVQPGGRASVPTGIAVAIPDGYVGLVWDKSGRALKDGLKTMAGVVDAGYRGEVCVVVVNLSDTPVTIERHHKVAQLLIQPVASPTIEVVESLSRTSRGENGFGSTGLTAHEL